MNILFGSLTAAERPFGLNAEPRKGNSPPALQTPSIWPGPLARRAQAPSGRLISAGSTIFGALSLTVPSNRIASGEEIELELLLDSRDFGDTFGTANHKVAADWQTYGGAFSWGSKPKRLRQQPTLRFARNPGRGSPVSRRVQERWPQPRDHFHPAPDPESGERS